jgi:hypothetical protein
MVLGGEGSLAVWRKGFWEGEVKRFNNRLIAGNNPRWHISCCQKRSPYLMRRFPNLSGPAFALIELLAILGIAAVLSSILLPALGEMKERARVERHAGSLR